MLNPVNPRSAQATSRQHAAQPRPLPLATVAAWPCGAIALLGLLLG